MSDEEKLSENDSNDLDEGKLSKNDSNDLDGQLLLDLEFEDDNVNPFDKDSYWKPSSDLPKPIDWGPYTITCGDIRVSSDGTFIG